MGLWRRIKRAVTRFFSGGGGGGSSSSRRTYSNSGSRGSGSSNTSTRRAYINAYKSGSGSSRREGSFGDSANDTWAKARKAFKASSSKATADPKTARREKAKKDTKDYFKATAKKLPKAKSVSDAVKSGNYEYSKPQNRNTRSADERYTITPTMKAYKQRGVSKGESFARGFVKGVSWGESDKLLKGQTDTEKAREKYYQKNKSKGWEGAGELAGSFVSFGGVGKLGAKGVGKLAATKGGKKLVARTAESKLVKATAKRAVDRAVKKGVVEKATKEYLEDTAKRQAGRLVKGLGTDAFINATGGLVSDVNRADENHKRFSDEWWKEMRNSALLNTGIGAATEVVPALAPVVKPYADEAAQAAGRKLKSEAGKIDLGDATDALRGYYGKGSKKKMSDAAKRAEAMLKGGDSKGARAEIDSVVDDIVRNTKNEQPLEDDIVDLKNELRNTRIKISNKDKTTAGYEAGSFNELRKRNFGGLKITDDGVPIDRIWSDLQERYGRDLFPDEIDGKLDTATQLNRLIEISKMKGTLYDLADDEVGYLKDRLSSSLWKAIGGEADEVASLRTRLDDLQKEMDAAYDAGDLDELNRLAAEANEIDEALDEIAPRDMDALKEEMQSVVGDEPAIDASAKAKPPKARAKNTFMSSKSKRLQGSSSFLSPEDIKPLRGRKTEVSEGRVAEEVAGKVKATEKSGKAKKMSAAAKKAEPPKAEPKAEPPKASAGKAETEGSAPDFERLGNNFENTHRGRTEELKKIYPEVRIKRIFAEDKKKKIIFGENELGELFVGDPWTGFGTTSARGNGFEGGFYKAGNYEQARKDYTEVLFGKGMPKDSGAAKKEARASIKKTEPTKKAGEKAGSNVKPNASVDEAEVKAGKAAKAEAPKAKAGKKAKTAETKAKAGKAAKAAEPKAEPPKDAELVAKGEAKETSGAKGAGKGERTEFRRGEEKTAKEQARNKRATGNKQKATQKTFDKDYADFEKKISEAQSKISELKGRLRVASEEEKAGIKKQIDDLTAGVKSAYNKASLRYHPDRGGSNEWMGKFNNAYDSFKRGSTYSSRGFKGAESSTRTRTNANAGANAGKKAEARAQAGGAGGGNTPPPPPRKAAAARESGNFRAPRGRVKKATRTVTDVRDVVNKRRDRVSSKEKVKDAVKAAKTVISNSLASFEEENLKFVKSNHEKWKSNNGAIDKHRRYTALAARSIDKGQLALDGRTYSGTVDRIGADGKKYTIQNGKSLKQIYEGMDKDTEAAFDAYLLLKHAPDRIREGTPIFDRINLARGEGEVIKNLNDPKVVKEEADRLLKEFPEFAEKAEEIYQYTHNELENRVRAGLLSQETASKWMHDHPFYVPTGRDGYFNVVHGKNRGIVGADPIKAAKGSDLDIRSIKEQLADATSRNWRDITANNLLEKFFGDKVKTGVSVNSDVPLLNDTVGLAKSADGRKYYAKIFRNGDINHVEIDKDFYDGLEDLYKNGRLEGRGGAVANTVSDATSRFSGTFKKLVTSWNPIFLPKNFSRDMGEALINTRQTKEFVECLPSAWKELQTNGAYAQAFENSGVSQANFVNVYESLNKEGKFSKAVDKFVALQDMTESFPRLAEYMATLKKAGVDISDPKALENVSADLLDQAAANAADVTVNFGRSGSVGKNLNKGLVPFFNPSIQGWSKFVRNFSEQRGTKQLLGTIGKAVALGAGVNAVNNFLLSDNKNYQQISAREKATNVIIPVVFGKDRTADNTNLFIKIPMSRFAAVYGLPTVNVANENKMGWAEMIKVASDQVLPVDPTESSLFAPLYQAHKNETWYGAPIEPEYLEENYMPAERYDANTSPFGKAAGAMTRGLPTEMQISPKKADYVIDAATGVFGDFALPMSTALANGGNVAKAGADVVKKAFAIDSTTQNDLYARFNDKLEKATWKSNSRNAGDAEQKEADRLNAYSPELRKINTAMKSLQDEDSKGNQKNLYAMQKVRNQMLQDALDGKEVPPSSKTLDAVQKYVGTTYAIENFGSSADREAMKAYGAARYGELSEKQMKKAIDSDKDFYKGVSAICKLDDRLKKEGLKGKSSTLGKAVALASVGADDDLLGAYRATKKGRTETATKAERARTYLNDGGSTKEFIKLEKARKTLGKLTDYDEAEEQEKNYKRLQRGEISLDEYHAKEDEINYNANLSYVGLATSFAQANAPSRGYALYDIKAKNAQKGINLAAMGFTSRDYRKMAKEVDADGNGYPSRKEVINYVANSNVEDKATLFDALYYYKGSNPFGAPTRYSRDQAAAVGKANGVEAISNERGDLNLKDDSKSSSGGYGRSGYSRRSGRRRSGGGGSSKTVKTSVPIKASDYKADKATYKDMASALQVRSTSKRKTSTKSTAVPKITPPKVKFKKYEV